MSALASEKFFVAKKLDERPVSVYDNLNAMLPPQDTSGYICKRNQTQNSNNTSPYSDISFKFDDPINNGSMNIIDNKVNKSPQQALTTDNYLVSSANAQRLPPSIDANGLDRSSNSNTTTTVKFRPQKLSQHSDTDDSGGHQNIATVKAVISDAKSKFFGLNNSIDNTDNLEPLLLNNNDRRKIQVTKPQPKYQNIPENSAIFQKTVNNNINNSSYDDNNEINIPTTVFQLEQDNINIKQIQGSPPLNSNRSTKCFPHDMDFGANQQPSQIFCNFSSPQAVYMSTTVPQNIKGSNIAGRHTPTRNSLRHSRMLVVNKNYQGTQAPNPLNLRHPSLAKFLLTLEVVIGILTTLIGIWILLWAPNTRTQDNPYWSGLAVTLAGILGLVVIRYRRIKRQKLREHCFTFVKLDSYLLTLLASILCFIAFVCAAVHLSRLTASNTKCTSADILIPNAACICVFGSNSSTETSSNFAEVSDSYEFQYRDLSCEEVEGAWKFILGMSICLNVLGFLTAIFYLIILCLRRNSKRLYTNVHTNPF